MPYNAVIHRDAVQDVRRLWGDDGKIPPELLACLRSQLERLLTDPVNLGERPLVPYKRSGQLFPFQCRDAQGVLWDMAAIYTYADTKDENTIQIASITLRRYLL